MTRYEELLAEYDGRLLIEERDLITDGLYCDGVVWINRNLTAAEKIAVAAEEIGHYETSSGDILNQGDLQSQRQEIQARRWGYRKVLPPERIQKAIEEGYTTIPDVAEYLDIDEQFLVNALAYYVQSGDWPPKQLHHLFMEV